MAGRGTRRETVIIRGGKVPTGETELRPKAEIRHLLGTSRQERITSAGSAYAAAAQAITDAVAGIDDYAGKILSIWKGPDADRARIALEAMYGTGRQLARTFVDMGRSLETYAGYIPTAIAEVDGIQVDGNDARVRELGRTGMQAQSEDARIAMVEDGLAQEALKRLNEKIRSLYLSSIPFSIDYELPSLTLPATPGSSAGVVYGSTGGVRGTTFGTISTGQAGVGGTGSESGGFSGGGLHVNQVDGRSSGTEDAGFRTKPDNQPGQDQPAVQEQPGPTDHPSGADQPEGANQPGSGGQPEGADQPGSGAEAGRAGADAGIGAADAAAPQVIGAENGTAFDDAAQPVASVRTETAAYQPTTPFTAPTIGNAPVSTVAPVNTVTPPASIVPPVTGSPSSAYSSGAGLAAGRAGSTGETSSMPFMPVMGGGGAAAGAESGDLERGAYLPEDRAAWNTAHDVTDPVIG